MATGKKKGTLGKGTARASLFSQIYNNGNEATKAVDEKHVERSLRRKWESAYDDAEGQQNQNSALINAEYAKMDDCDINQIIELQKENDDLEVSKDIIAEHYQKFFGVALAIRETEEVAEEATAE